MNRYSLMLLPHPDTHSSYWDMPFGHYEKLEYAVEAAQQSDFYTKNWNIRDNKLNKTIDKKDALVIVQKLWQKSWNTIKAN